MPSETDTDQMDIRVQNRFHGFVTTKTIAEIFAQGLSATASPLTFTAGPIIAVGTGTPEGAVTAPVGSLFLRTNGGAATSLYVKESGAGNTGWVGK